MAQQGIAPPNFPLIAALCEQDTLILPEEWDKKLDDVKIRKEDMNRLVMNFFVTEGYAEAAENFQRESGIETGIDLRTIIDRMAVKDALQRGNVEQAIEKVNAINPEILKTNPQVFFHLQQQGFIELIRKGETEEAMNFGQEELVPMVEKHQSFLKELEKTSLLLAYENLAACPVIELLNESHRLKTASEVNAAILTSQRREKESKIATLLKMLVWAQGELSRKAIYSQMNYLCSAA